MTFNDDEPIVAAPGASGGKTSSSSTFTIDGKTKVKIINKTEAPLEKSKFKVMLELTGAGLGKDRSGVDLVTVLDVSGSMKGEKLAKMKTAMQFVIKKLSPLDRLSVVTFSGDSTRLCRLHQMTEDSQKKIETQVNALCAGGSTNITAGLQTGLQVLNDRTLTVGRVAAIMLMSDGDENHGGYASQVPVGSVSVHTFGFGTGHDPRVLKAVADNSMGGTFSDVQNTDNLSIAFSQCLAGLLTVAVQDLQVTVTPPEESMTVIEKVSAGNYPQFRDDAAGSVTVSFGNLYDREQRKVIVDLLLPAVSSRQTGVDVLQVTYTYSAKGRLRDGPPLVASITRTGTPVEKEREEVMMEEHRLQTARMMKEARVVADDNMLADAQNKLVQAENLLDQDVDVDKSNPLIEMLKSELQQLLRLMTSPEIYGKRGRPFALSSETSHDRQRFAARGHVEKLRMFATPRMDAYLEQVKSFVEDPSKPLPTAEEDLKQELAAADPLAPIIAAVRDLVQTAIQSLKSVDDKALLVCASVLMVSFLYLYVWV